MKIGDYVEVDIGMGLVARGQIVTEDQYMGTLHAQRGRWHKQTLAGTKSSGFHGLTRSDTWYRIEFLDGSTHTALESECRLIEGKEKFVLKLKGANDEMAQVYEAMDNGN